MTAHAFPLIEVRGDSYALGRQHGEQAGALVHRYLLWIEKLSGLGREALTANAMRFLPAIRAASAGLIDEIRGLADGACISFEEAVLCQARAEAANVRDGGCTAFAVRGSATSDGRTLIGQNQDLEPEYADVAILLRVRPNDGRPAALMFTFAGQLGYSGLNDRGVAHFANALYGMPTGPGIPHYPLKRVALEQSDVDGVVRLFRTHPACSAANMVIADGDGAIVDIEIAPGAVVEFEDRAADQRIHANHCATSELAGRDDPLLPDTFDRAARMDGLVRDAWGSIDVDAMKAFLADHQGDPAAICRHGANQMHSVSGYIAQPHDRVLHVRRGHGCLGTWTAYSV